MKRTVKEISELISGVVVGDFSLSVDGISGLKEASEGDLSFLANPKYLSQAKESKASVIIVGKEVLLHGKTVIQVDNPSLGFSKVVDIFLEAFKPNFSGIHDSAVIAHGVELGENVAIGPNVVIEEGCIIGNNSIIHAGSYVGVQSVIGEDCLLYPNVTVREKSKIGNRVIIHSSTVIGSDGFGYATVDGKHVKIPQLGNVIIEDDVEIGACVTVDRARFESTCIGAGTKIDNLVQIAHNVQIGENSILVAQSGISGSSSVGKGVIIAGQVGIAGHLTLGDGVVAVARAGVTKSFPANTMIGGFPARNFKEQMKLEAQYNRLPKYIQMIKDLENRVQELEKKLQGNEG